MATPTSTSLVSNVSLLGSNNSVFQGRDGNDTLVGGHGNDSLVGGLGNNTYIVNSFTDTIKESLNGGIDTVQSSVIFALGDNLENLTLTGNSAINGYGNSLNNCIKGNAANNYLFGGDGNDTLKGGAGNDTVVGGDGNDTLLGGSGNDILAGNFGNDVLTGGTGFDQFEFYSPTEGIDTITDFKQSEGDKILVSAYGFGGDLVIGTLPSSEFTIGSSAADASHAFGAANAARFIYNPSTGGLFFDADGIGPIGQVQFATLGTGLSLTSSDICVFA